MEIVPLKRRSLDVDGYYRMLGVESDASQDEVRHAAKKLLIESHPDTGGSHESFIDAVNAYRTLCDPGARADYDARTSSLTVKVAVKGEDEPFGFDFGRTGTPAWYKEPAMVLDDDEKSRVLQWHQLLLDAARGFRQPLEIKVGMCRCPVGYYVQDDIVLIGRKQIPTSWAAEAYILMKMCKEK